MTTKNTLSLAEWKLVVRNVIVKPSVPLKFAFKTFKNVINYYYQIQVYGRKKQTLTHTKYLFVCLVFCFKMNFFFSLFSLYFIKKKRKTNKFWWHFPLFKYKKLKRKKNKFVLMMRVKTSHWKTCIKTIRDMKWTNCMKFFLFSVTIMVKNINELVRHQKKKN